MNSHSFQSSRSIYLGLLIVLAALGSGCTVANRRALKVAPFKPMLAASSQKLAMQFDDTLPGTNLNVTVWDNVVGPFADAKEAKRIGYTQNYNKVVAVGMAESVVAAEAAGPYLVESRIVIPFGPIFMGTFQSGMQQTFPGAIILTNSANDAKLITAAQAKYWVNVRVAEFRVWEGPLNHINLTAKVTCHVQPVGDSTESGFMFEVQRQATQQKIGTMMSTSGGFIRKMNEIANTFAGDVTMEILETLQKKTTP
jgi:hypothetical protein